MSAVDLERATGHVGPLSDENYMHALTNVYWVVQMACGLELIAMTGNHEEATAIAREHLRLLIDPVDGLHAVPEELQMRWKSQVYRGGRGG
jgi:hypothetical protein